MAGELISREALDRIIKRAAELQAHERDIGEGLTKDELLALGKDVGIPTRYLQHALLEEQTRSFDEAPRGLAVWLAGPAGLASERVVPGDRATVERALARWLEEGESLQVKRRFPERTTWEARRGAFVSIQRALSTGGRRYALTRAVEVTSVVSQLEPGFCHVRLTADVRNIRAGHVGGFAAMAAVGSVGTAGMLLSGLVAGALAPLAVLPIAAFTLGGLAIARSFRKHAEPVAIALAQVLDRLEHGELKAEPQLSSGRPSTFLRIADEIKKTFEQL